MSLFLKSSSLCSPRTNLILGNFSNFFIEVANCSFVFKSVTIKSAPHSAKNFVYPNPRPKSPSPMTVIFLPLNCCLKSIINFFKFLHIVKMMLYTFYFLIIFMTFASAENDVPFLSQFYRFNYCLMPICYCSYFFKQ